MTVPHSPTVALTLGDPAGIGPELVAKLAARSDLMQQASVVLVGDRWLWEDGQRIAGTRVTLHEIASIDEARAWEQTGTPLFLPIRTVEPSQVPPAVASVAGGASVLAALRLCLDAAVAGKIDAICFAPLNKQAMKLAGLPFEDELRFFADHLDVRTYVCELNALDGRLCHAGGLLAGLVVYPSARLLFESFVSPQGHLTLSSYLSLVAQPRLRVAAWHSLMIASLTTAGCVLLGVPMAWAVARSTMPLRGFVRTAASLTLASPSFLGALAWILLLGPGAGKLNRLLIDLLHLDGPPFNVFSPAGIVLVQTLFLYPLVFLVRVAALETADPALEDSAWMLGARRWRVVRTVSLPLAAPAIFSGAILVFVESLVLFGPPAVLGMPVGYQTVPTQMFLALRDSPPRPDLAAAMALPVILIIGGLLAAERRYARRRRFTTIWGKRESPRRVDTGRWGYLLAAFCLAVVIVSIILPFGMLLMVSFQRSFGRPFGLDNLAPLENFRFVFQQSAVRSAFTHSLTLAALASAACMGLSVLAAWLVDRARVRAGGAVALSMLAPLAIPGPVLGVALLLAFAGTPWHLGGSLTILFLAYVVRGLPLAFAYARSGLLQIHPELEEACRTMGAHWHQALRTVVVPLSRGSWLAAGMLNFVLSFRELGASIFLYSGANVVTAVVLYDFSQEAQFTLMAAVSILVVLINLLAVWSVRRWVREGVAA